MTRWLVVVLLAANLGFMAWMYQRMASDPSQRPTAETPAAEAPQLRLLSELPAEGEAEAPAPAGDLPSSDGAGAPRVAPALAPTPDEPAFVATTPGPWTGREAPAGAEEAPPAWRTLEQLAVVSPAIPSSEPMPEETAAAPPPPKASDTCLTLGPLAAEASARRLSEWLVTRGGTAVMRPEITGRPDAHWLYIGPFADLSAARLESDRLRDLGVTDHLAVRNNELGPVVSLGLYSTQEGRERRIASLRAAGVEPVVVPRGPRETRWWVDARLPPESGLTPEAIAAASEGAEGVMAGPCVDAPPDPGGAAPLAIGTSAPAGAAP